VEALDEGLILCHIVHCTEMQSNHIDDSISLGGDQHHASSGPVESEGAVKVHAPVLLGSQGRRLLCFGPFHHEGRQSLRLDFHLWDICYVEPNGLESRFGNPSRGEVVPDNFSEPV
jgi:hypothetical protein